MMPSFNALLKMFQTEESNETYWFPTPQEPGGETEHITIPKRILHELTVLQNSEKLKQQDN